MQGSESGRCARSRRRSGPWPLAAGASCSDRRRHAARLGTAAGGAGQGDAAAERQGGRARGRAAAGRRRDRRGEQDPQDAAMSGAAATRASSHAATTAPGRSATCSTPRASSPSPLPSGPLMRWGAPGLGTWITVYANARPRLRGDRRPALGHLGRRMGQPSKGPRWRATMRPSTRLRRPPRGRPLSENQPDSPSPARPTPAFRRASVVLGLLLHWSARNAIGAAVR